MTDHQGGAAGEWKWFEWSNNSSRMRWWIDCKLGKWWYVLLIYWGVPGAPVIFYRSKDATPPQETSDGYYFIGKGKV